ncbi:MAG: OmpA family protein [Deltaproteobacteria bacterium]|nr:OmpA family protein [Deltaproteobacteria bacterium]
MLSRRYATPSLGFAVLALALLPSHGWAQVGGNFDLQAFRPAMDSRGYITVNASQILGSNELSFGLVTNWGHNVLELSGGAFGQVDKYESGNTAYTVQNIITPTLQVAYGLLGLAEIGVSVPFMVVSGDVSPDFHGGTPADPNDDDEFGFSSQGVGDVGIHAKIRFLNTSKHPVGFAVVGSVFVPAHDDDEWLGEKKLTFQPMAIVDKEFGRGSLRLAANAGLRIRTSEETDRTFVNKVVASPGGVQVPSTGNTALAPASEIPFGLGMSYAVVKQKFDLVAEVFGSVPLGGEDYMPLEASLGIKLYLARNSFFLLGGGAGFLPGSVAAGNPDVRGFLGIVFEPNIGDRDGDGIKDDVDKCPDDPEDFDDFEDTDGCPEPDNDRDGILDGDDSCPNEPEDKDGQEDEDGCPEADDMDRDGDGILDDVDQCPDDPEDKDNFEDSDGCPEPDNDQDGILDVDDVCINDPEDKDDWEDKDGCPDPDNDKDRILDRVDACPNEPETYNGKDDEDGCPDKGRVVVTSGAIEILDKIYFETNKAVIKPESYPILDAIAATLQGNPDILLIEIGGHADERAKDEYNLRLTQDRSEAVKKYLVDNGVEETRLKAVGYGETRPIDPRHNEAAWSKNRRVEFLILKRAQ